MNLRRSIVHSFSLKLVPYDAPGTPFVRTP
jgi:hypothetical protein